MEAAASKWPLALLTEGGRRRPFIRLTGRMQESSPNFSAAVFHHNHAFGSALTRIGRSGLYCTCIRKHGSALPILARY